MTKRVLALLLAIAMVLSLVPVVVAETDAVEQGYTLIMQKAHNQTGADLAVDIYLQANAAAEITGYQFTVVTAEGTNVSGGIDETGNDNLYANKTTFIYPPIGENAEPIAVGTERTLVATITVAGAKTLAEAQITLEDAAISQADEAEFVPELKSIEFACDDHECGHGTGEWKPITTAEMSGKTLAAGNYYLTEDVTVAASKDIDVAAGATVTVCLNGYNIEAENNTAKLFVLDNKNATLNICDCTATGEGADYESGKLIYKNSWGGALRTFGDNCTINVFGGIVDGSQYAKADHSGSAIYINGAATFNMTGGKLVNLKGDENADGRIVTAGSIILRGNGRGEVNAKFANVTFDGYENGTITADSGSNTAKPEMSSVNDTTNLVLENVTMINGKTSEKGNTYALRGEQDKFGTITIKGNCQFDKPVYLCAGDSVILDLAPEAKLILETDNKKDAETAETISNFVAVAEGATLPAGTVYYKNQAYYLSYADGQFQFAGHTHEAKTYEDGTEAGHTVEALSFRRWTDPTALPTEGNWYLDTDVTMVADTKDENGDGKNNAGFYIDPDKTVNLDLNGHTITCANEVRPYSVYGTLNLFDCQEAFAEDGTRTGGKITGYTGTHGTLRVQPGGQFNLYSGEISGNGTGDAAKGSNGAGVYVYRWLSSVETDRATRFTMYGGEISGNSTDYAGAAITVNSGDSTPSDKLLAEVAIHGGKIRNNTTSVVSGGTTTDRGNGGAIRVMHANFKVTGGEFTGNKGHKGGVFYVGSGSLTITGGIFKDNKGVSGSYLKSGTATSFGNEGGVLYVSGGTTEITGGTFTGNSATNGGVAFGNRGTLTFKNITISGNTGNRGGVLRTTGYSSSQHAVVNFENCNITGNKTNSSGSTLTGSAMTIGSNSDVTLKDTTITGNHVNANEGAWIGGAVWLESGSGKLILEGKTVIAGNTAKNQTGDNAVKNRLLARDIVIQDTADGYNASTNPNSIAQILDVSGLTDGAKVNIYNYQGNRPIEKVFAAATTPTKWNTNWVSYYESTDTNRGDPRNVYAESARKAMNYVDGEFVFVTGHVHTAADGSLITYNEVDYLPTTAEELANFTPAADGTYYFALTGDVTKSGTIKLPSNTKTTANYIVNQKTNVCLNGHELKGDGRLFIVDGSDLTVDDCTAYVDAAGDYKAGGMRTTASSTAFGAVVRLNGDANFTMKAGRVHDMTFNSSTNAPSGYIFHAPNDATSGSIKLLGGEVENITATAKKSETIYGIVADVRDVDVVLEMKNFAIRNVNLTLAQDVPVTDLQGLLIRNNASGATIIMDNVLIENNSATVTKTAADHTSDVAADLLGMICITGATTLKMDNCTFRNNSLTNNLVITNGTKQTKGTARGGAIHLQSDGSGVTGSNNVFIGNEVAGIDTRGGAINSDTKNQKVSLSNSTFTDNKSSNNGGVVYIINSGLKEFTNCTFTNNTAGGNGGAIYSGSSSANVTLTGCTFTKNSAANGGAVCMNFLRNVVIEGTTFTGNTATARAGALYLGGGADTDPAATSVTIGGAGDKKVVFDGNHGGNGGAIYAGRKISDKNASNLSITIDNVEFKNNTSSTDAVAYLRGGDNTVVYNISNSTLTNNVATGVSSGLRIEGSPVANLSNLTITGNTGKSHGALFFATNSVVMSLSGKMVITDNVSTDYAAYAENTDVFFQKGTGTYAKFDVSGLTEGSQIGVMMGSDRCAADPVITQNGGAAKFDYFFSNSPERYILAETEGELALVKHVAEDGTIYNTAQEVVEAAGTAGETTVKLQTNWVGGENKVTLPENVTKIDLNGYTVQEIAVPDGKQLELIDSASNDFDNSDVNAVKVIGEVKPVVTDGNKTYVVVKDGDYASSHRIHQAISSKLLRTANRGVGFKAIYAGDQTIEELIKSGTMDYGIELSLYEDFSKSLPADFGVKGFTAGIEGTTTPNLKVAVIKDILMEGEDNATRANWTIYGRPYMVVDGVKYYGATITTNLNELATHAKANGTEAAKTNVTAWETTYGLNFG